MAQAYRAVYGTFWTGDTGKAIRKLGREAQVLAFYVVTSPHANMIGLYHLPLVYAATDTGMTPGMVAKAMIQLQAVGFVTYDEAHEWIWVREMCWHQIGQPKQGGKSNRWDNRIGGIDGDYHLCPSGLLQHAFYERYSETYPLTIPNKPLPSPLEGTTAGAEGASVELNSTQQNSTEQIPEGAPAGADAAVSGKAVNVFFRGYCDQRWSIRQSKYQIKPAKHVPLVRALLKTYGLPRLLQIAELILRTDEAWISGTDRGIEIVSTKAAWADDYLAAHGIQAPEAA